MARRGRAGSEAALAVLVFGTLMLAFLSIYAIGAGVVVAIGWLYREAGKARANARAAKLVRAEARPVEAVVPDQDYWEILPVNPEVFDDLVTTEAAAHEVFTAWARRLPAAPRNIAPFIQGLQLRTRFVGRLESVIGGRHFAWRRSPYHGPDGPRSSPVDENDLDPWNPPPAADQPRFVDACKTCHAKRSVPCQNCGGSSRLLCSECQGAGKAYGIAKNGSRRLMNCQTCKKEGTLVCPSCNHGSVRCQTCGGSGKMLCVLELEEARRNDVQVEPDGAMTKAFPWGKDGVFASKEEISRDARIAWELSLPRRITAADVIETAGKDYVANHWTSLQPRLQKAEQLIEQRFSLLEIPAVEVTYGIGEESETIELQGRRLLGPPASAAPLFRRRAEKLRNVGLILFPVPFVIGFAYTLRGEYFLQWPVAAILLSLLVAVILGFVTVFQASLARPARRLAFATAVPLFSSLGFAVYLEPSAHQAHEKLARGELDATSLELSAMGPPDSPRHASLWADLRLKQIERGGELLLLEALYEKVPASLPQKEQARAAVDAAVLKEAESALKAGTPGIVSGLLAKLSEKEQASPAASRLKAEAASALGQVCVIRRDWECAHTRLMESLSAPDESASALALKTQLVLALGPLAEQAATAAQKERTKKLDALKDVERLYAILAAADPEAFAKKHETVKRSVSSLSASQHAAKAAARKATQPLRCCDGTLSASCTCGDNGPGCCAHNGGVCQSGCN